MEGVVPAADVAPGGVIEKGPSNDPPPDHDEVVLITKVGSSAENPLKKFPPLPKSMLKKPGGLSPDQAGTPGPPVNVPGTTPLPPPTIDWGGQVPRAIIFSNKRLFAEKVAQRLTAQLYKVAHLHSKLDQAAREEAVRKFQTGEARVLVATNIAARGLDFDVKLVVQMDLPDEITSYTHRIGRTVGLFAKRFGFSCEDWFVVLYNCSFAVARVSQPPCGRGKTLKGDCPPEFQFSAADLCSPYAAPGTVCRLVLCIQKIF